LDKVTNEVLKAIFQAQSTNVPGSIIQLLDVSTPVKLPPFTLPLAELKALKRQFLKLNNQRTVLDVAKVRELFVSYLNENLAK
jgi:protein KTI12